MAVRSRSAFHGIQPWCDFDAVARVVASTLSFGVDLNGGAQAGCSAHCGRTCYIILTFIAGSMLKLVENPQ